MGHGLKRLLMRCVRHQPKLGGKKMHQELSEHAESYLATLAVLVMITFAIIVGITMIRF